MPMQSKIIIAIVVVVVVVVIVSGAASNWWGLGGMGETQASITSIAWQKVGTSSASIQQIAVGNSNFMMGLDSSGNMYYMQTDWRSLPGSQRAWVIATTQDGAWSGSGVPLSGCVWCIDTTGTIRRMDNGSWTNQMWGQSTNVNGCSLSAADAMGQHVVFSNGHVSGAANIRIFVNGNWWTTNGGSGVANQVCIGTDGTEFAIMNGKTLNVSTTGGKSWTPISPSLSMKKVVCSSQSRAFCIDTSGNVYNVSSSSAQLVASTPANVIDIACGADCVAVLDSNGQCWMNMSL